MNKGTEYPSKKKKVNKSRNTDRMALGILHLYFFVWFISCPHEMEITTVLLF